LTALSPRREWFLLMALMGIQFTHIVDFMVIMPLGPQLTTLFGIQDAQFGWLVSAYTFAAGISGLVAALYVDRFSRKRLLLYFYTGFILATLACAFATSYFWLLCARIAAGTFGGVLGALVQTIVGDAVPFTRRGRAMGIVMSAFPLSTVAGVPLALFLANLGGWHMPFVAVAVFSLPLFVFASLALPQLEGHLHTKTQQKSKPIYTDLLQVVLHKPHWQAFWFSALVMFTGFTVIPYISLYLQTNAGVLNTQIPYIYLCGGVATLISNRVIGVLSDRLGKAFTFQALALLAIVPILGVTLCAGLPLAAIIGFTTAFFVLVSGRMVPGMAFLTAAVKPSLRGTFLSINAAVQSTTLGLAALLGGHLIYRDPATGHISHYWLTGLVGALTSLLSLLAVRQLNLHISRTSHQQEGL
jgi:predicted MFS family arabinose efflux permease